MRRLTWLVAPAAMVACVGCSSSDTGTGDGPLGRTRDGSDAGVGEGYGGSGGGTLGLGGSSGGSSSAGASSGGSSTGGSSSGGTSSGGGSTGAGGAFPWVDFSYTPPPTPDAGACAATTLAAQQVEVVTEVQVPVQVPVEVPYEVTVEVVVNEPAGIYLMLDKSGSMDDHLCLEPGLFGIGCSNQRATSKWEDAVAAIGAFVNDPNSNGLSVALEYFSLSNHQCDGTGYDVPAVAMAELPGNATAITTSLGNTSPGGGTPTEGALNGIRKFCQAYNSSNPGEPCVGVLITDGEPANCNTDSGVLTGIASATYGTDGNQVFTVGMAGANFGFLDSVAIAGGTDCTPGSAGAEACTAADEAAFLAALHGIVGQIVTQTTVTETRTEYRTEYETQYVTETQQQAIPCEYSIPQPDSGIVDPSQIEVVFSAGSAQQYIPPGGGADQCGDGWYFDDPTNPTKILFCPTTCTVLESIEGGQVDIEFGCLGS